MWSCKNSFLGRLLRTVDFSIFVCQAALYGSLGIPSGLPFFLLASFSLAAFSVHLRCRCGKEHGRASKKTSAVMH